MSKKDLGILIYHEWLTAMESLSAKDVKALLMAMRDCQVYDVPPPKFKGSANVLASVIFPSIERRKKLSDYGKRGMEARLYNLRLADIKKKESEASVKEKVNELPKISEPSPEEALTPDAAMTQSLPVSQNGSVAVSLPPCSPDGNSIEEHSTEEHSTEDESIEKQSPTAADDNVCSAYTGDGICYQESIKDALKIIEDSLCESERRDLYPERYRDELRARAEKEGVDKFAYGKYNNVFLTADEYMDIKQTIKNADTYINMFSHKLHAKGYRYEDHAKAILEWWARDREFEERNSVGWVSYNDSGENATDYDAFFEAAVRKALGDN